MAVDRKGFCVDDQVGAVHAQDHEGDGAHCRLPDLRSQARIIANRPYRNGMRRIIVEAAKADPAGAANSSRRRAR